jgi:hypothetical protein
MKIGEALHLGELDYENLSEKSTMCELWGKWESGSISNPRKIDAEKSTLDGNTSEAKKRSFKFKTAEAIKGGVSSG